MPHKDVVVKVPLFAKISDENCSSAQKAITAWINDFMTARIRATMHPVTLHFRDFGQTDAILHIIPMNFPIPRGSKH